jgi:Domain of unknown function (DUF6438)
MLLNMIPSIKLKSAVSIVLLVILNNVNSAVASPIEQPVVAFAVTNCDTAYLIRLFESGKVEYRGNYGVKTLGKHETEISPQAVKDLLKKFTDAGSFNVIDDRLNPSFVGEAIYLRQGNKTAIFSVNPLLPFLREQTLRVSNATQWFDYKEFTSCKKSSIPTFGRDPFKSLYVIKVNRLKLINY